MDVKNAILTKQEMEICSSLSKRKNLDGKRAKALLALEAGDSQPEAAKKSGLTYGQVKYLLSTFRKKRLSVFPNVEVTDPEVKPEKKEKIKKKKSKEKEAKMKKKKEKKESKKDKKKLKKKKSKKSKDKKSKKGKKKK